MEPFVLPSWSLGQRFGRPCGDRKGNTNAICDGARDVDPLEL
jgi:hypothetical protein